MDLVGARRMAGRFSGDGCYGCGFILVDTEVRLALIRRLDARHDSNRNGCWRVGNAIDLLFCLSTDWLYFQDDET